MNIPRMRLERAGTHHALLQSLEPPQSASHDAAFRLAYSAKSNRRRSACRAQRLARAKPRLPAERQAKARVVSTAMRKATHATDAALQGSKKPVASEKDAQSKRCTRHFPSAKRERKRSSRRAYLLASSQGARTTRGDRNRMFRHPA